MKDASNEMCDVPAQVLCLSATPPLIKTARIVRSGAEGMELDLEDPETTLQEGMRVVLAGGEDDPFRIMGVVTGVDGCRLKVKTERVVESDKRDFPRLQGGLTVRFRVLVDPVAEDAVAAWLSGGDVTPEGGEWRDPDPFMDFSGSGLRFDDRPVCDVGDLLLVELQVPPAENKWRATASVVRLIPLRKEEMEDQDSEAGKQPPTHHIAVRFEHLPGEATEALAVFALSIQDALLKI
jgi:hypothetical protein